VDAASHLRDDIEYRTFPYQVGYYSDRRWTESPDRYLRRALELGLFEEHQCVRSLSGYGAILDATLVSFAEVRAPASARVAVHFVLHDGPKVLADATVEARRPAEGAGNFDAVVRALSDGLAEVVARIVRQVQLSTRNVVPG
jgi:cholesterol transport system auxiliary component